jgi:hypothetical protein
MSTEREADAKGTLHHYRWRAILNYLLDNKSALLPRPSHGVNSERHEHSCLTTLSPLLYLHPTPSYTAPKSGSSFCHIMCITTDLVTFRALLFDCLRRHMFVILHTTERQKVRWTWKDLEGSSRDLIQVITQHLCGLNEKTPVNPQSG